MDSRPAPPLLRSLRPWYLVATMLLTWIVGVHGFMGGCGSAMYLRDGTVPDVMTVAEQAREQGDQYQFMYLVLEAARGKALSEFQHVMFPLSIAKMLLCGLLVVASGLALGGRPGSRVFALQVLGASLAFVIVDYSLSRDMRVLWIELVARAGALLPEHIPERQVMMNPAVWWMAERIRVVLLEFGTLALAIFALTRERTKSFFEAVARAIESAEEEP